MRPTFLGCPSSSTRPACSLIAVAVPIVSKKSVSMKLKIVRMAARAPSTVKTLVRSNCPSVEKFGVAVNVVGSGWTPVRIATMVVTRMLSRSAAGTLRAHSATVRSSPNQNTKWAGVGREDERRRDRVLRRRAGGLDDDPGVDEADEQDEQADADADGALQRQRDGAHDRLAQADQDEDRDEDAFEDDDAHRARPGVRPWVRTRPKATAPLMPRPAAMASGVLAMTPHREGQEPAMRAVAADRGRDGRRRLGRARRPNMFDRMPGSGTGCRP